MKLSKLHALAGASLVVVLYIIVYSTYLFYTETSTLPPLTFQMYPRHSVPMKRLGAEQNEVVANRTLLKAPSGVGPEEDGINRTALLAELDSTKSDDRNRSSRYDFPPNSSKESFNINIHKNVTELSAKITKQATDKLGLDNTIRNHIHCQNGTSLNCTHNNASSAFTPLLATNKKNRGSLKEDWYQFIIDQRNACEDAGPLDLVVMVISLPTHVQQRLSIRRTWGAQLKADPKVRFLFFLGQSTKKVDQDIIVQENDLYKGDIVQAKFVEGYHNLTLKTLLMLRWVMENCGQAKFVLKTDDDMFIHPTNLLGYIRNGAKNMPPPSQKEVLGRLAHRWVPDRNQKSKWYVSRTVYPLTRYPDFVTGPAYLLGRETIPALLTACHRVTYLYLEDVFVTGLCAQQAGVIRKNHGGFANYYEKPVACHYRNIISGHGIGAQDQHVIWSLLQTDKGTGPCPPKKRKFTDRRHSKRRYLG